MSLWPVGTLLGGRPYAELGPKQLYPSATQPPIIIGASPAQSSFVFPWASQGFTWGSLELQFTQATAIGSFQLYVRGINSEGLPSLMPVDEMPLTNALVTAVSANNFLQVTFGNGPLPGNTWFKKPGGPGVANSNPLNPTMFDGQASLRISLLNLGVDNVTLTQIRLKLRG